MLKNLIFDVGEVLLEYRWGEALTDIGVDAEEAREIGGKLVRDPVWMMMDYGVMSAEEVAEKMKIIYPEDAEKMGWILRHPEHLVVPRPEIWERVHRLKEKGYRIYILSNYGKDMWEAHAAYQPFMRDLDGCVVSCRIHLLKPDARIYEYLLREYGLKREESVFFDDKAVNTEGARAVGLPAVTIPSRGFLAALLDEIEKSGGAGLPAEAVQGLIQ